MNETAVEHDAAPVRILVVDDDPHVLSALADLLREEPRLRVVGEAAGVEDAIASTFARRPDALLVDVHMPGGGAQRIVTEIRAQLPQLRIIALSAAMDQHEIAKMLSLGADMCFSKTADFTTLIRSLTR